MSVKPILHTSVVPIIRRQRSIAQIRIMVLLVFVMKVHANTRHVSLNSTLKMVNARQIPRKRVVLVPSIVQIWMVGELGSASMAFARLLPVRAVFV